MNDIKKLRELAEAATQGEWISITDHPYLFVNHHNIDSPKAWDCKVIGRFDYETDMEYFRYANPATILALLDRLEAAERDAAAYRSLRDGTAGSLFVARINYVCDEYPEYVNVDELVGAELDAAMKEKNNGV